MSALTQLVAVLQLISFARLISREWLQVLGKRRQPSFPSIWSHVPWLGIGANVTLDSLCFDGCAAGGGVTSRGTGGGIPFSTIDSGSARVSAQLRVSPVRTRRVSMMAPDRWFWSRRWFCRSDIVLQARASRAGPKNSCLKSG